MAISEKQRQKKLLKKKQKRTTAVKKANAFIHDTGAAAYAVYPVHECLIPSDLFTTGIGELIISRHLPSGEIAFSAFILDVFCLGVKNAFFSVRFEGEYESIKDQMTMDGRVFERIDPSCAWSLLKGAVDYAEQLGFDSHPDYKKAVKLFGNIDASDCRVRYDFGQNGKPMYIRGPHESPARAKKIVDQLFEKCGEGGFDYLIASGPG